MKERSARTAATAFTVAIHAALIVALVASVAWKQLAPSPDAPLTAEIFGPALQPKITPIVSPPEPPAEPKVAPQVKVPAEPKSAPQVVDADIAIKRKQDEERSAAARLRNENEEKLRVAQEKLAQENRKLSREKDEKERKTRLLREADRDAALRAMNAEARDDKQSLDRTAVEQQKQRDEAARRAASERAVNEKMVALEKVAADKAASERADAQRNAQRSAAAGAARDRAKADYIARIRSKVRGNVVYAQEIVGRPEAIFEITQLPSGEVMRVQLRKSSGSRALDDAIERAIQKSSPLPKPDDPEIFDRTLILQVRPND